MLPTVCLLASLPWRVPGSSRFTEESEVVHEPGALACVPGSGRNDDVAGRHCARPVRVSQGVEVLRPHLATDTG
jgi:hypothetical protein